jgi:hypothetical protein
MPLLGFLALSFASSAAGAPAWRAEQLIAASPDLLGGDLVAAQGRAVVLWSDVMGDACAWHEGVGEPGCRRVFASELAGSRFRPPFVLSADGRDITGFPVAAVLPNRELLVAWRSKGAAEPPTDALEAAVVEPGGDRAGPVQISHPGDAVERYTFAANAAGRAILAWSATDAATHEHVVWASHRSPGGPFQPAVKLAETAGQESFDVALNDRGETLVVWTEPDRVLARTIEPSTSASPTTVVAADSPEDPDYFGNVVAQWMTDGGRAAAWIHSHPNPCDLYCYQSPQVEAANARPGAAFGSPVVVSRSDDHHALKLIPDRAGTTWLSWIDRCECPHGSDEPFPPVAQLSVLRPASGFTLGSPLRQYPTQRGITLLEPDTLELLFVNGASFPEQLMSAWRPNDPAAELVTPISRPGPYLSYAGVAPLGGADAVAAWTRSTRLDRPPPRDIRLVASVARDDDVAPRIDRLQVRPRKLRRADPAGLTVTLDAAEPVRATLAIRQRRRDRLSLHHDDAAQRIRFTIGSKRTSRLARGPYIVRVAITDRAGHETARIARFRVVRGGR